MRFTLRFSVNSPLLLAIAFLAGAMLAAAPQIQAALSLVKTCVRCAEFVQPLFQGTSEL